MAGRWQEKVFYTKPVFTEHSVAGHTLNFYPVSVEKSFKFKDSAVPIIQAITLLMSKRMDDVKIETVRSGDGSRETINPIAPDLALFRQRQQSDAIKQVMDGLLAESSRLTAAEIIIDSLREVFPRGAHDNPTPEKFINDPDLDLPTLFEMIIGVVKANRGIFGPLAGKATELVQRAADRMEGVLAGKPASPSPVDITPEEIKTPGNSSSTKSPGSSSEDTTINGSSV